MQGVEKKVDVQIEGMINVTLLVATYSLNNILVSRLTMWPRSDMSIHARRGEKNER